MEVPSVDTEAYPAPPERSPAVERLGVAWRSIRHGERPLFVVCRVVFSYLVLALVALFVAVTLVHALS
jgi:hypothetical protein